jgi:hypothetical protein
VEPRCSAWPRIAHTFYTPEDSPCDENVEDGKRVVLGQQFKVIEDGVIHSFRYYRSSKDVGEKSRTGYIYSYPSGMVLSTTGKFTDKCGEGGWVTVPLLKPLRIHKGRTYLVAIDNLEFYAKSEGMFKKDETRRSITMHEHGARYGFTPGNMPIEQHGDNGASSYWIDSKSTQFLN